MLLKDNNNDCNLSHLTQQRPSIYMLHWRIPSNSRAQEGQSVLLTKKKDGAVGPAPAKVDTKGQKRFGNIERPGYGYFWLFLP